MRDAEDGLAESQDILSRESHDLPEINDLINRFSELIALIPALKQDFDDMRQVLSDVNSLEQNLLDLEPLLKDSFEGTVSHLDHGNPVRIRPIIILKYFYYFS